ncbi:uncharacterized protein LOC100182902 [Ciona intestinalis]
MDKIKGKISCMMSELDNKGEAIEKLTEDLRLADIQRRCVEEENINLKHQLNAKENFIGKLEPLLDETVRKLASFEERESANDRIIQRLESDYETSVIKCEMLEDNLKEVRFISEETGRKYEEATRRLTFMDTELEKSEQRIEKADKKYKEVSSNLHLSLQCIKKYESMNEKLKEKEIQTEDELCTLQKRLYESENLRAIAENSLNNLAQQVGVLEDELYEVKMKI